MRDQDLMRQIAALDPVTAPELSRLDSTAAAALREGIAMTTRTHAQTRRRRLGGRSLLTGGLTVALLGGGLAYAVVQYGWPEGAGDVGSVTCLTEWADPHRVNLEAAGRATGGPPLTGDPVADCQQYQALSGLPPIDDPVAFHWGPSTYVAPRSQVPADATLLEPEVDAGPVHELSLSTDDYIGGLGARCLSTDDAVTAAQAELDRLGLVDWQVTVVPRPDAYPAEECANVHIALNAADALEVWPNGRPDRDDSRGTDIDEIVFEIRDTFRAQISDQCLDLDAARAVVDTTLRDLHHWPTTSIVDADTDCTRAYMEVGGSIQVTLYGPEADVS